MRVVSAAGVAFFAWFSVDAAALLAGAALARANDCSIGYRELGGVQGLPQVREHVCVVSPGGARRTLRVTFARLDEQLAGNLALGEKTPELDQLFSGAIFVANEVSAEVKLLFQKFAHKVTVPARNMELTVSVGTPRGGETIEIGSAKLPSLNPGENETRRLWSISSSDATVDRNSEYGISMQNLGRTILRTTSWPDGFMQFYSCQEEAIQCTRIWRYVARLNELDAIE